MQVTLLAQRSIFESALNEAAKVGAGLPLTGLRAPIDGVFSGRLEEAWDSLKSALESAYDSAAGSATELWQRATAGVDLALAEAGQRANDLAAALRERLRAYMGHMIAGLLRTLRGTIEVDGLQLTVAELDISQKVILGGSLKTALSEAFALTTSGEFMVNAKYRVAPLS